MFGLRDAEIVSEVARAKGFRAAAAALGVAPSAVSARIGQVEQMLGAQMFDRSRRGAHLTPIGRHFLEQAERLLSLRDDIAEDISNLEGLRGTLRIGVAETIVHSGLRQMIRRLAEAAPRVRLELSVDISENLNRALCEDTIDIAVLMRQWAPRAASRTLVESVKLDWFAAPSVLPGEVRSEDIPIELDLCYLADWAVITFAKESPPQQEVARILSDPRLPPTVVHSSSPLSTIVHLTRDGLGVGTIPRPLVADECADGRLKRIDFGASARLSDLDFELCYLSPSVEEFAQILTGKHPHLSDTSDLSVSKV